MSYLQKNQQHVGSRKEYQSHLSEMIDAKMPLKEVRIYPSLHLNVLIIQKQISGKHGGICVNCEVLSDVDDEYGSCQSNMIWQESTLWHFHDTRPKIRRLTELNNLVPSILFTLVNNIEQCCWNWVGCNNIVQFWYQLWTIWAANIVQTCSYRYCYNLTVFNRVNLPEILGVGLQKIFQKYYSFKSK